MNTERLCAVSRALDAAIRWHHCPQWRRRGTLAAWMCRAYKHPPAPRASRDAMLVDVPYPLDKE